MSDTAKAAHIWVARDDLRKTRIVEGDAPDAAALKEGEVLFKVDDFAFTANNITYAAFGVAMKYWDFFPADEGWGRVPVWGFGDVIASKASGINAGERFYGYFPMSTHFVAQAVRVSDAGFFDGAAHRAELSPVYNNYLRVNADPGYDAGREAEQSLLRPLFTTSFLIDDFLDDNQFFGASTVLLSSASSKTSLGLAQVLSSRKGERPRVVGLTSKRNIGFVESVGYYDDVIAYEDIPGIGADGNVAFVDMAGDAHVRAAVHNHFGDRLTCSCAVGGTHWEQGGGGEGLPGARPTLFFAPSQIQKRNKDWGADELQARIAKAWAAFLASVDGWMKVETHHGIKDAQSVYLDVLEGKVSPETGMIVSLWEA
ncbi:MAG: DUF2855 family protein [Parvibaculaceae bacterium]